VQERRSVSHHMQPSNGRYFRCTRCVCISAKK